jgi:hypothetical protein
MRPRHLSIPFIFGAVFAVILVLLASCSIPPNSATQVDSPNDVQDALVEHVAVQGDPGAIVSATMEPAASQAIPVPDGPALLKTHCVRCHVITSLDQIEKPRNEWENALARMEAMGVNLSDTEKEVLLNYLAVADQP